MASRRPGAFTLIELLVVIAVIGLLVAILLPALRGARSQAREVVCRTQLGQYARGFHYYLGDNQDVFPKTDYGASNGIISEPAWFTLIDAYWTPSAASAEDGRRYGLARCPELNDVRSNNDFTWEWDYSYKYLGYGYNRFWLGWNMSHFMHPRQVQWRRMADVRSPAECLLVADSQPRIQNANTAENPLGHYVAWGSIASLGTGVDTRHGATSTTPTVASVADGRTGYYLDGRGNIAWVDGHVDARTSPGINDKFRWQRLWDPEQIVDRP